MENTGNMACDIDLSSGTIPPEDGISEEYDLGSAPNTESGMTLKITNERFKVPRQNLQNALKEHCILVSNATPTVAVVPDSVSSSSFMLKLNDSQAGVLSRRKRRDYSQYAIPVPGSVLSCVAQTSKLPHTNKDWINSVNSTANIHNPHNHHGKAQSESGTSCLSTLHNRELVHMESHSGNRTTLTEERPTQSGDECGSNIPDYHTCDSQCPVNSDLKTNDLQTTHRHGCSEILTTSSRPNHQQPVSKREAHQLILQQVEHTPTGDPMDRPWLPQIDIAQGNMTKEVSNQEEVLKPYCDCPISVFTEDMERACTISYRGFPVKLPHVSSVIIHEHQLATFTRNGKIYVSVSELKSKNMIHNFTRFTSLLRSQSSLVSLAHTEAEFLKQKGRVKDYKHARLVSLDHLREIYRTLAALQEDDFITAVSQCPWYSLVLGHSCPKVAMLDQTQDYVCPLCFRVEQRPIEATTQRYECDLCFQANESPNAPQSPMPNKTQTVEQTSFAVRKDGKMQMVIVGHIKVADKNVAAFCKGGVTYVSCRHLQDHLYQFPWENFVSLVKSLDLCFMEAPVMVCQFFQKQAYPQELVNGRVWCSVQNLRCIACFSVGQMNNTQYLEKNRILALIAQGKYVKNFPADTKGGEIEHPRGVLPSQDQQVHSSQVSTTNSSANKANHASQGKIVVKVDAATGQIHICRDNVKTIGNHRQPQTGQSSRRVLNQRGLKIDASDGQRVGSVSVNIVGNLSQTQTLTQSRTITDDQTGLNVNASVGQTLVGGDVADVGDYIPGETGDENRTKQKGVNFDGSGQIMIVGDTTIPAKLSDPEGDTQWHSGLRQTNLPEINRTVSLPNSVFCCERSQIPGGNYFVKENMNFTDYESESGLVFRVMKQPTVTQNKVDILSVAAEEIRDVAYEGAYTNEVDITGSSCHQNFQSLSFEQYSNLQQLISEQKTQSVSGRDVGATNVGTVYKDIRTAEPTLGHSVNLCDNNLSSPESDLSEGQDNLLSMPVNFFQDSLVGSPRRKCFMSPSKMHNVTKPGSDVIVTKPGSDVIVTKPGGDVIVSKLGGDVIVTKPGSDVIVTKPGSDVIVTKPGSDVIVTKPGGDVIVTKPGGDVIMVQSESGEHYECTALCPVDELKDCLLVVSPAKAEKENLKTISPDSACSQKSVDSGISDGMSELCTPAGPGPKTSVDQSQNSSVCGEDHSSNAEQSGSRHNSEHLPVEGAKTVKSKTWHSIQVTSSVDVENKPDTSGVLVEQGMCFDVSKSSQTNEAEPFTMSPMKLLNSPFSSPRKQNSPNKSPVVADIYKKLVTHCSLDKSNSASSLSVLASVAEAIDEDVDSEDAETDSCKAQSVTVDDQPCNKSGAHEPEDDSSVDGGSNIADEEATDVDAKEDFSPLLQETKSNTNSDVSDENQAVGSDTKENSSPILHETQIMSDICPEDEVSVGDTDETSPLLHETESDIFSDKEVSVSDTEEGSPLLQAKQNNTEIFPDDGSSVSDTDETSPLLHEAESEIFSEQEVSVGDAEEGSPLLQTKWTNTVVSDADEVVASNIFRSANSGGSQARTDPQAKNDTSNRGSSLTVTSDPGGLKDPNRHNHPDMANLDDKLSKCHSDCSNSCSHVERLSASDTDHSSSSGLPHGGDRRSPGNSESSIKNEIEIFSDHTLQLKEKSLSVSEELSQCSQDLGKCLAQMKDAQMSFEEAPETNILHHPDPEERSSSCHHQGPEDKADELGLDGDLVIDETCHQHQTSDRIEEGIFGISRCFHGGTKRQDVCYGGSVEPDTAADLSSVEPDTAADVSSVEPDTTADVSSVEPDTTADVSSVEPDTAADVSSVEPDTAADVSSVEPDTAADVSSVEPGTTADVSSVEPDTAADLSSVEPDTAADVSSVEPDNAVGRKSRKRKRSQTIHKQVKRKKKIMSEMKCMTNGLSVTSYHPSSAVQTKNATMSSESLEFPEHILVEGEMFSETENFPKKADNYQHVPVEGALFSESTENELATAKSPKFSSSGKNDHACTETANSAECGTKEHIDGERREVEMEGLTEHVVEQMKHVLEKVHLDGMVVANNKLQFKLMLHPSLPTHFKGETQKKLVDNLSRLVKIGYILQQRRREADGGDQTSTQLQQYDAL